MFSTLFLSLIRFLFGKNNFNQITICVIYSSLRPLPRLRTKFTFYACCFFCSKWKKNPTFKVFFFLLNLKWFINGVTCRTVYRYTPTIYFSSAHFMSYLLWYTSFHHITIVDALASYQNCNSKKKKKHYSRSDIITHLLLRRINFKYYVVIIGGKDAIILNTRLPQQVESLDPPQQEGKYSVWVFISLSHL